MSKRRPFQKVLLVIAAISYLSAMGCGIAASYLGGGLGDPITASFMASVVFFAGVGVVLHMIGITNLPNLKIERE
ncbi:MAG: hemerythrin family protein [Sedimenticola sp.]